MGDLWARVGGLRTALLLASLVLALRPATPAHAHQADCPAGSIFVGSECQVSGSIDLSGAVSSGHTLHILGGGTITVPVAPGGNTLDLTITGALLMDPGAAISGDVGGTGPASGVGATLNITATGNILLAGNGFTGARITSNQSAGSCTGGRSGNITLTSTGGDVTTQDGSVVSAGDMNAGSPRCPAGEIRILAPAGEISIGGDVLSQSTQEGTGAVQPPGGGPITIKAGCLLTISDTGVVSSRGLDPGADLVHLEGCLVQIYGLVESTGRGHGIPNSPTNHCYYRVAGTPGQDPRPDKSPSSTACIEVWSGTAVVIDSLTGQRRGELNADIGFTGGSNGRSWIDVYARGSITVLDGDANDHVVALPGSAQGFFSQFAVHANMLNVTNGQGGLLTLMSTGGSLAGTQHALQADATPAGGRGGQIQVSAAQNVSFNTASIFARGDFIQTGGFGVGGAVTARAYSGTLVWQNGTGDVRPTGTNPSLPAANRGTITYRDCTAGPIDVTGTVFPNNGLPATTPTEEPDLCVPAAPTPPGYVSLPSAECQDVCGLATKRGVKFNGVGPRQGGEPGLPGWEIHLFGTATSGDSVHLHTVTQSDGSYEFIVPPGAYTVCETLQPGWVQTFPVAGTGIVSCAGHAHSGSPGPLGYQVMLAAGQLDEGNDFGNITAPPAPAIKRGTKWHDLNGDGVRDDGEPPLAGWEIHIFNDGVHLHTVTDQNGQYVFNTLSPGSYTVCETIQGGWTQTFPSSGADCSAHGGGKGYAITLTAGQVDDGNDFGNRRTRATKRGTKFQDANGNGVKDVGDAGLAGWEIHLFGTDADGASVHLHTTTNGSGSYEFVVAPGSYTVCETIQSGWTQTFPTSGADCSAHGGGKGYAVTLSAGQLDDNNDFGNTTFSPAPAIKRGVKWHDLDGNGVREQNEPGLSGWEIHIFNASGFHQHAFTDQNGQYVFNNLAAGSYTVCETIQPGWTQTFPTSGADCSAHGGGKGYAITLGAGQVDDNNDFGNTLVNPARKRGLKWHDLNGNGVREAGEPPLEGWRVHLFSADLSVHQHVTTGADGRYEFVVPAGSYTVCETVKEGWTQTFPTPGAGIVSCSGHGGGLGYQISLAPGQIDEDNDFGNAQDRRAVAIPTLSEWGMLLMLFLLVGIACRGLWRQRRLQLR